MQKPLSAAQVLGHRRLADPVGADRVVAGFLRKDMRATRGRDRSAAA